jgi:hypothetical protein
LMLSRNSLNFSSESLALTFLKKVLPSPLPIKPPY